MQFQLRSPLSRMQASLYHKKGHVFKNWRQRYHKIRLLMGDIVKIRNIDAIVTSSNENLVGNKNNSYWRFTGRTNVDGSIRNHSNEEELDRMLKGIKLNQGDIALTKSTRNIKSNGVKYLIHTIAPDGAYGYDTHISDKILTQCYSKSLIAADDLHCNSIAFPALGCGVKDWPAAKAAVIAYKAISEARLNFIKQVDFIFIGINTFNTFKAVGDKVFGLKTTSIQTEEGRKIEYPYIGKI